MIAPHHGTHWHSSMNSLSCQAVLCSVGGKLFSKLRPEYKEIASECYATYFSGNLVHSALGTFPEKASLNIYPYFY